MADAHRVYEPRLLGENCWSRSGAQLDGSLETILSWDPHFWLQRGSLEVDFGDLNLAEHFLSMSRSFNPDDVFLQTEWAYLLFKKA